MRLIDADELITTILTNDLCGDDNVDKAILNAPTVNAIPIEWIRNYVSIWISEPYKNFALNMIDVWEKENDNKHTL